MIRCYEKYNCLECPYKVCVHDLEHEVTSVRFGSRLRRARLARHITQKSLAETLDVWQTRLSHWEMNEATPPPEIKAILYQMFPELLNENEPKADSAE